MKRPRVFALRFAQSLLSVGVVLSLLWVFWQTAGCGREPAPTSPKGGAHDNEAEGHGGNDGHQGDGGPLQVAVSTQRSMGLQTVIVSKRALPEVLTTTGTVLANDDNIVKVGPRVAGRLVRLYVKVGSRVSTGQPIATLDSVELAEAQAAVRDAEAKLNLAEKHLETQRKLAKAGHFRQAPLEEAENAKALATAEVAAAEAELSRTQAQLNWAKDNLSRKQKLAELGEYQDIPYEEAKDRHAEAVQALRTAEAELTFARQNQERLTKLHKEGIAALRTLQEAQAARRKAEADVTHARQEVQITRSMLDREEKVRKAGVRVATEVQEAQTKLQEARKAADEARSRLTKAREQLRISEQRLKREQNIHDQNLFASKELRAAEAAYESARITYESAKESLNLLGVSPSSNGKTLTRVVAPMSGMVIDRPVNRGEMVGPETVIATILDLNTVWVDADVYQKDVPKVGKGQPVRVFLEGRTDRVYRGQITYLSGKMDAETRTVRVRAEIHNPTGELRPGMFVTAEIELGATSPVLAVPPLAVQSEGDERVVYVQAGPTEFERREVTVGRETSRGVEILAGLEEGETVVTQGAFLLRSEQAKSGMVVHAH